MTTEAPAPITWVPHPLAHRTPSPEAQRRLAESFPPIQGHRVALIPGAGFAEALQIRDLDTASSYRLIKLKDWAKYGPPEAWVSELIEIDKETPWFEHKHFTVEELFQRLKLAPATMYRSDVCSLVRPISVEGPAESDWDAYRRAIKTLGDAGLLKDELCLGGVWLRLNNPPWDQAVMIVDLRLHSPLEIANEVLGFRGFIPEGSDLIDLPRWPA